jgi:ribosomal-protein-alanine N-acetyltransferase
MTAVIEDRSNNLMLESERLSFRKITQDDLPWLIEMRAPESISRYLGGTKLQNPEALAKRMKFYLGCHEKYGFGICVMGLKETGEPIGTSGLQPLEDTGEIEVGYNMSEQFWRHGYGYECAMAWLRYGFEKCGIERIVAVAYPANVGSWRIMEKCGMKYEKSEEHYGSDCVLYAISHEEFQRLHG